MHLSIAYAGTSMVYSCSEFCGGGVDAGVVGVGDFPKSEAKEEESREALV
jgi:hypothetical protein